MLGTALIVLGLIFVATAVAFVIAVLVDMLLTRRCAETRDALAAELAALRAWQAEKEK